MTNRTKEPVEHDASVQHDAGGVPPPVRRGSEANRSVRKASVIAGTGLLLMTPPAVFGNLVAIEKLVTPGDPARTAWAIMDSEGMFRLGIVGLYLAAVLDVLVAWALLRVFSPVSKGVSMLAAWFRIVYVGVLMVAISQLVGVLRLLGNDVYLTAFNADQLNAQVLLRIDEFKDIWDAGLILFGLHLLIIGYLAYKSGYVPKILGILLAVAGFGYVFDSLRTVLYQGSWTDISSVTFLGELLLAFWLLIWGRRISLGKAALHADQVA